MPASGEPFGTTPLPTSSSGSPVQVTFDIESVLSVAQQPQTNQIATFEASKNDDCINGRIVDVNQHFVVYGVKNGLIRVLHRGSPLRTLLRGHKGQQVTDIRFFQDGDVMATAAKGHGTSSVMIWRIFEHSPEIQSEILLEISTTKFAIFRVIWHPFNPNQFWMIHTDARHQTVATLVETTRITTTQHATEDHAVCEFHDDFVIMPGAVQLSMGSSNVIGNLTDLCWSERETRYVLSTYDSGDIILWDLKQLNPKPNENGTVSPEPLCILKEEVPLSRCLFLPHENGADRGNDNETWTSCFVTASENNCVLTLWSAFSKLSKPAKLQVVSLEHSLSSSCLVDVCSGPAPADASPPSCFLVMADRTHGQIAAFHCRSVWNNEEGKNKKALLVGCDYVVPFHTKFPTYSWTVTTVPTTDITEEELSEQGGLVFDMKLFAYQSTAVQSLTLTSYMCLPPEKTWTDPTPGVKVERLLQVASAHVSEVGSIGDVEYDEDYDLGDDDAGVGSDVDAPDPSSLPAPQGFTASAPAPAVTPASSNPFANWLGAIAAKSSTTPPPPAVAPVVVPPAPTPPPASDLPLPPPPNETSIPLAEPPVATEQTFLSPMDILKGSKSAEEESNEDKKKSNSRKKKSKSPKPNRPSSQGGQVEILKRTESLEDSTIANGGDLAKQVRMAVREEISSSLLPELEKTIQRSLDASLVQPLQSSISRMERQGIDVDTSAIVSSVADSVDEPLKAAFADGMRTVFVPALESITSQVFAQISDNLQQGMASKGPSQGKELEAISAQLSTMTQLVAKLTSEVQSLRSAVAAKEQGRPASAPPAQSVESTLESVRVAILGLLRAGNYEAAFTKAVSLSTAELAVFCCENADIKVILGGSSPVISQTILLCLMQQLGTVLNTGTAASLPLVLEWLQEISLSLNPADPRIQGHVPKVLQELVGNIDSLMTRGDPALRRPLQRLLQVVRGMQMG